MKIEEVTDLRARAERASKIAERLRSLQSAKDTVAKPTSAALGVNIAGNTNWPLISDQGYGASASPCTVAIMRTCFTIMIDAEITELRRQLEVL